MSNPFSEIDSLLSRANKIYLSYSLLSFSTTGLIFYRTSYSRATKVFATVAISLPLSGLLAWTHILKTFAPYEIAYLNAGLDKSYPSVKSSNFSKFKKP
jgi:hypothetical protein